ncbi:MAG: dihydroorotate dehydrogenase electron transfer subunit [Woeseiaceae bacterium]
MSTHPAHRNTIHVEDAILIEKHVFDAEQFIFRLNAPATAKYAEPGTFVHITCDSALPLRRPLSLMRVNAEEGWIEILFKIVGAGLAALANKEPGTKMSVMGPIGKPFQTHPDKPIALLIGGGVGIPPMIYLAEALSQRQDIDWAPIVFMGSEIPFPFSCKPSALPMAGMPDDATHALTLVEEWQVPSRLASLANLPGAHQGYVTDLASHWLAQQDAETLAQCEIFSCGPTPMLAAVAKVAERFNLPCQVSLEEYMACAVGGCAGCTVAVKSSNGETSMQRVCVDGPVFDAKHIF